MSVSPYMNAEQVAKRLHIAKGSVYRLTSRKQIPFRKPAGTNALLFVEADLIEWELGRELSVHENDQGGIVVLPRKARGAERETLAA